VANIATGVSAGGLQLQGLAKSFGSETVINGLDLEVPAGSTVALLGPSGCGKTTVLRIIAGLELPDAGRVSVGGKVLTGPGVMMPAERRRIGMVFQDWALFPHMTVSANVAYGLTRGDRQSGRVDETLEMVGLDGLGHRFPMTLSGGQQQRVAIARAVAPRPAVMLLDEPFSNLDADLRVRVRSEVHGLLEELAVTTLFVTHDQEEAFVLGDQVAVMHRGRIEQQDLPESLYERPVSAWVASFVGDANLLPGEASGMWADTPVGPVPLSAEAFGPCQVMVRPERLAMTAGKAAEVIDLEFYGHDTSYQLALPGVVLLARAMASPRFRRGDRVEVAYEGPPAAAYPAEASTPAGFYPARLDPEEALA
jgi:iron(III) transport system ATP-binding protein